MALLRAQVAAKGSKAPTSSSYHEANSELDSESYQTAKDDTEQA